MRFLLLAFIVLPIVEMLVLLEVGSYIGAWYTIMLVLLTAVIGGALLRQQGLRTLMQANQKMQTGQMPLSEMGEGLMLAVAGALLLTPGFVTDTIGFLLMTPGIRQLLLAGVLKVLARASIQGREQGQGQRQGPGAQHFEFHYQQRQGAERDFSSATNVERDSGRARDQAHDVIEGEYQALDEDANKGEKK